MGLPVLPNPCFGPDELGLCLGCCGWTWAWRGAHCAFGLADGIFGLFLYPYHRSIMSLLVDPMTEVSLDTNIITYDRNLIIMILS